MKKINYKSAGLILLLVIIILFFLLYLSPNVTCKIKGGNYKGVGMYGGLMCVIPYKDAGKLCTDSSQCLGQCVYTGSDNSGNFYSTYLEFANNFRSGDKLQVTGFCEWDNNPFKCIAEVKNDFIDTPVACLD